MFLSVSLFSDHKKLVNRKICLAFQDKIVQSAWVDNEAKMIASKARNFLKEPSWEIQKSFYQALYQHQRSFEERQMEIGRFTAKIDYFASLEKSVTQLATKVELLSI